MKDLLNIILFFIPRFVTDRVALARMEDGNLQVFCLEGQEEEGDELFIEVYGTINTFTWLGWSAGGEVHIDEDDDSNKRLRG